jgi:hypothetical protein
MELDVGRVLPDLEANIACGNSLIESDFKIPEWATRVDRLNFNPFDWAAMWPKIMASGGFDAVIGNPPYLNIDKVWGKNDLRSAYIKGRYSDVYADKTDILFYFLRRSADIGKGETSFIVSRSFLEGDKARRLRGWLGSNLRFREVLDFQHAMVFPKVLINTAIVRMTKSRSVKETLFRRWKSRSLPTAYDEKTLTDLSMTTQVSVPHTQLDSEAWNFGSASTRDLIQRMDQVGDQLGDILHIGQGMQTGANSVFTVSVDQATYESLHCLGFAYKRARTRNIEPYRFRGEPDIVAFPNRSDTFEHLPSVVQEILQANSEILRSRAAFLRGNCEWWAYTWPLHLEFIDKPRLICPFMAVENRFAIDKNCSFIGWTDTTVLYDTGQPEDLRYLAAVLNSDAMTFRFRFLGKLRRGGYWEYFENTLSKLPIPRGGPGEPSHDELVSLVDKRNEASSDLETALLEDDRNVVLAVVDAIDERINDQVADLFGLGEGDRELIRRFARGDDIDTN